MAGRKTSGDDKASKKDEKAGKAVAAEKKEPIIPTGNAEPYKYTPKHLRNAEALGPDSHGYFGQKGILYNTAAAKYSTLKSETDNIVKSARGKAAVKTSALDANKKLQRKYKNMDRIKNWANPKTGRKVGRAAMLATAVGAGILYGGPAIKEAFKPKSKDLQTAKSKEAKKEVVQTQAKIKTANQAQANRAKATEERKKRENAGNSNAKGGRLCKKKSFSNKFAKGGNIKKRKIITI